MRSAEEWEGPDSQKDSISSASSISEPAYHMLELYPARGLLSSAVLVGGVRFDLSSMQHADTAICLLTLASIMLYRACVWFTSQHAVAGILKLNT